MSEWWSYRLEDLLLFSPRVYWRMFELHNEAVWPLQPLALLAGVALVLLARLRPPGHERAAALLLGALWGFVGWCFLWQRYAEINWAAAYVAPAFWLQALLLAGIGGIGFGRRGPRAWAGSLLIGFALIGQPLLAPLFGRGIGSAQVFGIAPDPTAIGTLGLVLLARGRALPLLLPIPLLWCLLSGLTLWTMGEPDALVLASAAALALAGVAWRSSASGE